MTKKANISYKITILLFILISCTHKLDETEADSTFVKDKIIETPVAINSVAKTYICYQGVTKNDTISLKLSISNNEVNGSLAYNHHEKDSNKGTINGILAGDTLIANYKFRSEGVESEREVVFLTKNNIVREGYGDAIEKNGVLVYKDKSKLSFSKSLALLNVQCQ